jgi:hypothetical protein
VVLNNDSDLLGKEFLGREQRVILLSPTVGSRAVRHHQASLSAQLSADGGVYQPITKAEREPEVSCSRERT